MSTALENAVDTAIAPVRRFVPRRLRAVENGARRRPRRLYGILAVAAALTIAGVQMGLSILTTQTSYQLSTLSQQQRQLTWQKQILDDQIAGLSSPQYLAANATALGMVIGEPPSYLRLSDGALLGTGEASYGESSVDALGRASVPNNLIGTTPLVTAPDSTLDIPTPAPTPTATDPNAPVDPNAVQPDPATPPPLTEGLPSPSTH